MRKERRDAYLIDKVDGLHTIFPYVMPKRTDAEISMTEAFDVTELNKYMAGVNAAEGTNLKLFHAICTSVARTIYWRPKLNIFIAGRKYWQRKDITLSFVVKRTFEDTSEESLMFLTVKPEMDFRSISKDILGDVKDLRKNGGQNDIQNMIDIFAKIPRFILTFAFWVFSRLEYHGIMPKALTAGDPNYSSVLLSNLGSIRSDSCYHHLSNYGTCSVMITIGVLHKEQKLMEDGTWQPRDVINCTFTIDERLADGFYYAKSLRIAKYMLEHPEVMNEPISKPVPVEL